MKAIFYIVIILSLLFPTSISMAESKKPKQEKLRLQFIRVFLRKQPYQEAKSITYAKQQLLLRHKTREALRDYNFECISEGLPPLPISLTEKQYRILKAKGFYVDYGIKLVKPEKKNGKD